MTDAGVASADDVDTAMRPGVDYPLRPLAWAREWDVRAVLAVPDGMEDWYRDGHHRATLLPRRAALSGQAPF